MKTYVNESVQVLRHAGWAVMHGNVMEMFRADLSDLKQAWNYKYANPDISNDDNIKCTKRGLAEYGYKLVHLYK